MRHLAFIALALAVACGGSASQEPPNPPPPSPPPTDTGDAGRPCVQNVMCIKGAHWDKAACACVQ